MPAIEEVSDRIELRISFNEATHNLSLSKRRFLASLLSRKLCLTSLARITDGVAIDGRVLIDHDGETYFVGDFDPLWKPRGQLVVSKRQTGHRLVSNGEVVADFVQHDDVSFIRTICEANGKTTRVEASSWWETWKLSLDRHPEGHWEVSPLSFVNDVRFFATQKAAVAHIHDEAKKQFASILEIGAERRFLRGEDHHPVHLNGIAELLLATVRLPSAKHLFGIPTLQQDAVVPKRKYRNTKKHIS